MQNTDLNSRVSITNTMDRIKLDSNNDESPAVKSPIATKYKEIATAPTRPHQTMSEENIITMSKCSSLLIPQFNSNGDQIDPKGHTDNRDDSQELRINSTIEQSRRRRTKKPIFLKKNQRGRESSCFSTNTGLRKDSKGPTDE